MTIDILKRLAFLLVLTLVQVLVLNRIHLFNIATPLLYILLPLHFDTAQPRWSALLWSFCTGLLIDIFANTPGVAAGSMTLIGLLQPVILRPFVPQDDNEVVTPTIKTMGWLKYATYALIITFIYCLVFFTLESFTFFNALLWIECVGSSTLLTLMLVLAIEKIRE